MMVKGLNTFFSDMTITRKQLNKVFGTVTVNCNAKGIETHSMVVIQRLSYRLPGTPCLVLLILEILISVKGYVLNHCGVRIFFLLM